MVRTHVALPEDLVEDIDRLVGKRKRSEFLAEAARERLRRFRLLRALEETAGMFKEDPVPGWETPEDVQRWLAESRQRDDERLARFSTDG